METILGGTKIDEYEVFYSSLNSPNKWVPRIWLRGGGTYIGQLHFYPNGSALPSDAKSDGRVDLYYHLDDFDNIIDLLRNEKPMYLVWSGSGLGRENAIQTTSEPVGEAEK
jgi:hypothetical protein